MSTVDSEEISDKTHFFVEDSNDPSRVYAIRRVQRDGDPSHLSQPVQAAAAIPPTQPPILLACGSQTQPVATALGHPSVSAIYQKTFMKTSQPRKPRQPCRARKQSAHCPQLLQLENEDAISNEPGKPAEDDCSEREVTVRAKKKKVPCEPLSFYKLQAVHEKNPFQYAEMSSERKAAWENAVRLSKGTSDSTTKVEESEIETLKHLVTRHLKKYKRIDKLDFGIGEEREQQYEEYMKLMRDLEECKDNGALFERNPEKARKNSAITKRMHAANLATRSGISKTDLELFFAEGDEIDNYDGEFNNADLAERSEEMHFDRDALIDFNEEGIMESRSPMPLTARVSGSDGEAAVHAEITAQSNIHDMPLPNDEPSLLAVPSTFCEKLDKATVVSKRPAGIPATKKNTTKKSPFKALSGIRGAADAISKKAVLKRGRGQMSNLTDSLQMAVAKLNGGDAVERSAEKRESFWARRAEMEKDKADREERIQRETDDRAERDRVRALQIEKEEKDRDERLQERKERHELMKLELEVRTKEAENKAKDSRIMLELFSMIVKNNQNILPRTVSMFVVQSR